MRCVLRGFMEKIFWKDPYQTSLKTCVRAVNGNEILFEETIAYSFSGGQESDHATVNDMPVIASRKEGVLIYYTLPDNHGLQKNQNVHMKIDGVRRLKLMRLHFAAELVLEIVTRKYDLIKVGAHIAEHKSRIDFSYDRNIAAFFSDILSEFQDIVDDGRIIETGYDDQQTQQRYWKIDGFAKVPCGGTHVRSTKEVGYVDLRRSHPGKNCERIEITLRNP